LLIRNYIHNFGFGELHKEALMIEAEDLLTTTSGEAERWKNKYDELKSAYESLVGGGHPGSQVTGTSSKVVDSFPEAGHQLLKTVTSEVEAVLFALDTNGIFTFSDGRGLLKLGLKPGEVVGQSALIIYKDFPLVVEALGKSLKGEHVNVEGLMVGNLEFNMTLQPITGSDGTLTGVVGLAIDITETKKTERALSQSREKLFALMNNIQGMVYSCVNDHEWTMKFVSDGCAELTGYQPDDLIENKAVAFNDIIYPDDRAMVWNTIQESLSHDEPYDMEYRILTKKGEMKYVWERGRKLFKPEDSGEFLEGFITDISEKKRIEEELRSNYMVLRMAGKVARFGGWSADLSNNLVFWSDEVKQIHEMSGDYKPDVSKGISFYAPEWHEKVLKVFTDCAERGIPYDEEMEIITGKGRRIWIRTVGEPVYDKDGKIIRVDGSFQDINEQKKAEEALKRSELRLKELNATKDKFFSIIAHDLRSPFNSFLGMTQIMTTDLPSLSTTQLQEITISMSKSASNLHRLLENLLQWSQVQNETMPFSPEPLNLSDSLKFSLELMAEAARIKEVSIEAKIPGNLIVFADSNMLQTVLRNLISNSVKFTRKGGKVSVSARSIDDRSVAISVQDTGIGMSEELADSLFRIDVKSSRPGTEGEPGTGLGLLLCREFVEKHGGTIRADSREGHGSTFTFILPGIQ
jgi:PAS domain S-box-containing protein